MVTMGWGSDREDRIFKKSKRERFTLPHKDNIKGKKGVPLGES